MILTDEQVQELAGFAEGMISQMVVENGGDIEDTQRVIRAIAEEVSHG